MQRQIACIHTSPGALGPVAGYFARHAPELRLTNLLEDGLLRLLADGAEERVQARLEALLEVAGRWYDAEAALVTCSSVPASMVARLQETAGFPLVKVDEPMAQEAVRHGRRIGVVVTFPPTLTPTTRLLHDAAAAAGFAAELLPRVVPGAYDALLRGDAALHDALLTDTVGTLAHEVDVVVLAQVSMTRALDAIEALALPVPVLSALPTSLAALRTTLGTRHGARPAVR